MRLARTACCLPLHRDGKYWHDGAELGIWKGNEHAWIGKLIFSCPFGSIRCAASGCSAGLGCHQRDGLPDMRKSLRLEGTYLRYGNGLWSGGYAMQDGSSRPEPLTAWCEGRTRMRALSLWKMML